VVVDDAARYAVGMVWVDPAFERIARSLTLLELRAPPPDGAELSAQDLDGLTTTPAFVDVYTEVGLRRVLEVYGLKDALAAQGLADHDIRVHQDDPFRHRLELVLGDGTRIMDMRLDLVRCHRRRLVGGSEDPATDEHFDVVVVNWLLMQNPRRAFTAQRPRLPGQEHPGTGLGRQIHNLLVLLCRRIHRDALLAVPERFHLAVLYRRAGYRFLDERVSTLMDDVLAAGQQAGLSFAALAWAMERGFVRTKDGAPVSYAPTELVCPVSPSLAQALAPGGFLSLARLQPVLSHLEVWGARGRGALVVDKAGLWSSLRTDPVDGLAPPR
jgi:hypothetical protein